MVENDKDEKLCAYPDSVSDNTNLKSYFDKYDGYGEHVTIIQYCKSRKSAEQLAEVWNASYKRNGTYGGY